MCATERTELIKATVGTRWPAEEVPGETKFQQLSRLFDRFRGKSHLVMVQGSPDPDAMSSAMALDFLGRAFGIETTIMTFANVSHHENRTLVKRLGIRLVRYEKGVDLTPYAMYSVVDFQSYHPPIEQRLSEHGTKFFAFIDHHREDSVLPPAAFVDIREDVASTAAILTEYLSEAYPAGLDHNDPEAVRLATALMHGLRTDTSRFLLATEADFRAAAYLSRIADVPTIELIERRVLSSAMLGILEKALVNRRIHDNFIFSDVGFVRSIDRDGIPQAADLLLTREGTDTVLVFGIVDEQTIDGSLRTRSEMINPDEFLKGFLGSSPESGKYYGGGNVRDRGGFQIPLGFLCLYENKEQVYAMARQVIERSFLAYIGKTSAKS